MKTGEPEDQRSRYKTEKRGGGKVEERLSVSSLDNL